MRVSHFRVGVTRGPTEGQSACRVTANKRVRPRAAARQAASLVAPTPPLLLRRCHRGGPAVTQLLSQPFSYSRHAGLAVAAAPPPPRLAHRGRGPTATAYLWWHPRARRYNDAAATAKKAAAPGATTPLASRRSQGAGMAKTAPPRAPQQRRSRCRGYGQAAAPRPSSCRRYHTRTAGMMGVAQLGGAQPGVVHLGGAQLGGVQLGGAQLGYAHLGNMHVRPAEAVRPDEVRATKAGTRALLAAAMPSATSGPTVSSATESTPAVRTVVGGEPTKADGTESLQLTLTGLGPAGSTLSAVTPAMDSAALTGAATSRATASSFKPSDVTPTDAATSGTTPTAAAPSVTMPMDVVPSSSNSSAAAPSGTTSSCSAPPGFHPTTGSTPTGASPAASAFSGGTPADWTLVGSIKPTGAQTSGVQLEGVQPPRTWALDTRGFVLTVGKPGGTKLAPRRRGRAVPCRCAGQQDA